MSNSSRLIRSQAVTVGKDVKIPTDMDDFVFVAECGYPTDSVSLFTQVSQHKKDDMRFMILIYVDGKIVADHRIYVGERNRRTSENG